MDKPRQVQRESLLSLCVRGCCVRVYFVCACVLPFAWSACPPTRSPTHDSHARVSLSLLHMCGSRLVWGGWVEQQVWRLLSSASVFIAPLALRQLVQQVPHRHSTSTKHNTRPTHTTEGSIDHHTRPTRHTTSPHIHKSSKQRHEAAPPSVPSPSPLNPSPLNPSPSFSVLVIGARLQP
jgi:hypothetical protein